MEQENNEKTAIIADVQPVKQEKKTTRKPRQTRKKTETKKTENPTDDKPRAESTEARRRKTKSTDAHAVESVDDNSKAPAIELTESVDDSSKAPAIEPTESVNDNSKVPASEPTENVDDRSKAPAIEPTETPATDNAVPAEGSGQTPDSDTSSLVASRDQVADGVVIQSPSQNGRQQSTSQTAKPLPPCPTLVIHNIVELVNAPSRQLLLTDQQIQQLSAEEAARRFRWIEGTLALVLDYDIVISDTNIWLELLTGHTSSHSDPRFNCRLQFERQLEFISKLTRHRSGRFMMMSETYEEIDRFASQMEPQSHSDSDFSDDDVCRNIAARLAKRLILSQQRENRLRIEGIGAESHHSAFADPAIIRRCVELFAQGRRVLLLTNDASVAIRSMGMCDDLQRTNGIDDETWDNIYAPLRPMVMTMDDLKAIDAYTRQYHFLQMATGKAWMEDVPRQMRKNDVAPLTLWMEGFRPGDRHPERKQTAQQRKQNSQPKQEQKPQSKQEQKQQPKQEQKQQPKQEQKQQPKQEQKPQPKQEQKQQPKQEQKPQPKQEQKPQPKQEQKPQPKQEQKPQPKQEQKPQPKQEQKPQPKQEQKPQPKQEQNSQPKQEQKPQPKQEQKPQPEQEQQSLHPTDVQPAPQEQENQKLQTEAKPARRSSRKKKTTDSAIQTSAESVHDTAANETIAVTADIQDAATASKPKRQGRGRQTRSRQKQGGEMSSAS
ncbi:MAG: hypothetical protein MR984_01225 [Bacteroidales bacterium]|nr:hypothetical protein [Bacteroidales bacterium]